MALMEAIRQVLELAEANDFFIVARHISGHLNAVADLASREGHVVNTEWSLADRVFDTLPTLANWPRPTIDLFANSLNHRLPLYLSPCPDEDAMAIDALLVKWPPDAVLYAFPPAAIMMKVILKVMKERPQ